MRRDRGIGRSGKAVASKGPHLGDAVRRFAGLILIEGDQGFKGAASWGCGETDDSSRFARGGGSFKGAASWGCGETGAFIWVTRARMSATGFKGAASWGCGETLSQI